MSLKELKKDYAMSIKEMYELVDHGWVESIEAYVQQLESEVEYLNGKIDGLEEEIYNIVESYK